MARGRKNKELEIAESIIKLGAVLILLIVLAVGPKNFASAISSIFLLLTGLVVLAGIAIVLFIIIRAQFNPKEQNEVLDVNVNASNPTASVIPQRLSPTTLTEKLRTIDWFQFEKLVALAYEYQGYRVTRRGGANPDGGIDLVIEKEGRQSAVQCKQWKTWNVGVKAVREFLGALTDSGFQHGIFITLNGYTGDAKLLAEKHGIEIVNETGLSRMLERGDIQNDPRVMEILNDTRKFCPKCERLLVERVAGKGPNPGQRFWGCSGYPRCRFTMPMNL